MKHSTQPLSACCGKELQPLGDDKKFICTGCGDIKCLCDIATPEQPYEKNVQLDTLDTEEWLEKEIEFIVNPQPELSEMLEGNFTKLFKQLQKDLIRKLIRTEREKTEKAYGGCHKCYGKGYATYRHGLKYSADMLGDKDYIDPMETHMIYCTCDRGKQLKELVSAEKLKVLEAVKLEKPEFPGETAFDNGLFSGYLNAIDDLNAIREKIKNNI